jgi:hypothetical protein
MATNSLVAGLQPVGSVLPFSGVVTNGEAFNLTVQGATTLQKWDPVAQQYQPTFQYSAAQKVWKQGTVVTNPVISVGEGFFIAPTGDTNWVQTLP